MQVVVALVALPLVALLMALATRLEDGLRSRASSRPARSPLALTAGPSATPVALDEPGEPAVIVDLADAEAPPSPAV